MTISVSPQAGTTANTLVKHNSKVQNSDMKEKTELKKNTLYNKIMSSYQKTTSAFTEYPAKGLTGSKNSNFYEFLSMGIVPYLVGSATLMAVFNAASHLFVGNKSAQAAKKVGNLGALGVVFYGVAKTLSKSLISIPVKIATGIDTEMSYQRHVFSDPNLKLAHPINEYEQHKVMESHDFPRYDMMYGEKLSERDGKEYSHNYLFDKIAKKNGLGENLPASDTEVKPIIKDVISRSNTAKSLSSYLWAAVGVMLAAQEKPWGHFFNATSKHNWVKKAPKGESSWTKEPIKNLKRVFKPIVKNTVRIAKSFGRSFVDASKSLYTGPEGATGFKKHAGKIMIGIAAASTILGAINTIHGAKTAVGQDKKVFDKKRTVTVQ